MPDPIPLSNAPVAQATAFAGGASAPAAQDPRPHGLDLSFRFAPAVARPGRILTGYDRDQVAVVHVDVRLAGSDPALQPWDLVQQNYLASSAPPGAAGTALVLEALIQTAPGPAYRASLATTFRLGVALARLPAGPFTVQLRLRPGYAELCIDGACIDEDWPCGGLPQPIGRLESGPGCTQLRCAGLPDAVENAVVNAAMAAAPSASSASPTKRAPSPSPPPPDAATATIPGSRIQYWTPPGANQWLGDTMMFQDGKHLHILYLIDRRHGSSKAGCGGHQIAHLSTTDLRTWTQHPLALPIAEPWETCGTGSLVRHDGRWWIIYGLHTDRIVVTERVRSGAYVDAAGHHTAPQRYADLGGAPMGTALAVSDDGVTFRPLDILVHPAQNPSVFADPDGGFCLFAGYGATGLYRSEDLLSWRAVDHFIIPHGTQAPSRNTTECICHHAWNGWHYLLGGRTGFWMSRAMAGPYWDQDTVPGRRAAAHLIAEAGEHGAHLLNPRPPGTFGQPRWDIYDGLWVPMVAALADGRRILSGWLQGEGDWAGYLVLRELHQEPDGTLAMSWPREVVPPVHPPIALAWDRPWPRDVPLALHAAAGPGADAGSERIGAGPLPEECLITVTFEPAADAGPYGIVVLGTGDLVDGCELMLDPRRGRAQWSRPAHGRVGARIPDQQEIFDGPEAGRCIWQMTSPHLASKGRDFSITQVAGLAGRMRLRLLITQQPKDGSVIIDAELNGGRPGSRTLVTRRPRPPGRRLQLIATSGTVHISEATVQALVARP